MSEAGAAALLAAGAAWLLASPAGRRLALPSEEAPPAGTGGPFRLVVAAAAGMGAWVVLGGTVGVPVGVVVAVVSHRVLASAETPAQRREREAAGRELPHLVDLLAATLQAGSAPMDGLQRVCAALDGPAARRLRPALAHLSLGGSPHDVWTVVAEDPALAPLGRAMLRSHRTGASVVDAVTQLADELEQEAHAGAEDRARRVGVLAAIPLGVCLLPAFLLLGIVPIVASMLGSMVP